MYVMEGLSYERTDGAWQKIEVGVDDTDFERQCTEWGVDSSTVSPGSRFALLSVLAEMFVFQRQVPLRVHDEAFQRDKAEQARQISARLAAAKQKLTS